MVFAIHFCLASLSAVRSTARIPRLLLRQNVEFPEMLARKFIAPGIGFRIPLATAPNFNSNGTMPRGRSAADF